MIEDFEIVSGITVPAGKYDGEEVVFSLATDKSAELSFSLNATMGSLFGGNRISLGPAIRYRIGETFSSEISWTHNDIDLPGGDFSVGLGRLRLSYSFTPKMSIQALVQYNKRDDVLATNLRFAWLTSADTGLYIVLNEVDDNGPAGPPGKPRREFIIKYSHILDLL